MLKKYFRTRRTFIALSEALLILGFVSVALVSLLYLLGVYQIPGSGDEAVQVPASSPLVITADDRLFLMTESVVEVKLISASTPFDNEVGLRLGDNWGREIFSCQRVSPGFYDDLGTLPAGELTLMLTTPAKFIYFTGPGSSNPDDLVHARLQRLSASTVTVGWEDSFGGGDQDFNDCVVEVSAVPAGTGPTSVEAASGTVGSGGGTVETGSGDPVEALVSIPPGALEGEVEITIDAFNSNDLPDPPPGQYLLSRAFDFGPEGQMFSRPVTLAFTYSQNEVARLDENSLTVLLLVDGDWEPQPDCENRVFTDPDSCEAGRDPVGNSISIVTRHFSTYGIAGSPSTATPAATPAATVTSTATPAATATATATQTLRTPTATFTSTIIVTPTPTPTPTPTLTPTATPTATQTPAIATPTSTATATPTRTPTAPAPPRSPSPSPIRTVPPAPARAPPGS